jgi:hypothetical protein
MPAVPGRGGTVQPLTFFIKYWGNPVCVGAGWPSHTLEKITTHLTTLETLKLTVLPREAHLTKQLNSCSQALGKAEGYGHHLQMTIAEACLLKQADPDSHSPPPEEPQLT